MYLKNSRYILPIGLLLNASALIASTLLGFGGFSVKAFGGYVIVGHVSKLQMVFLFLVGVGLFLSALGYANQNKKQQIKNLNFILLLYLAVSMIFFALSFFGLTSQLQDKDFWRETTFKEIQNTLIFNNLTLTSYLVLGILQLFLAIIFFKTEMLQQNQLSKAAKILTLTSGIFLIMKTIIDYPPMKESIFILSYTLKIPILNNILSIAAPVIYLSAQIAIAIILLNERTSKIDSKQLENQLF